MSDEKLESLSLADLEAVHGGFSASEMPADARWIMQHESGGNPHAKNPSSTAFGAFQMLKATRKATMGADWQSHDLGKQYQGATKYVNERYGGWSGARQFWQSHHWY